MPYDEPNILYPKRYYDKNFDGFLLGVYIWLTPIEEAGLKDVSSKGLSSDELVSFTEYP